MPAGDPYFLRQNSKHPPALGHVFGNQLACEKCGVKWEEHDENPDFCPTLLARLSDLADLDAAIAKALEPKYREISRLKDRVREGKEEIGKLRDEVQGLKAEVRVLRNGRKL